MISKSDFLLNPNVVFLNHGSFGATPRAIFDIYQEWQRKLEEQPVKFIARELFGHLQETREVLGKYLHTSAGNLVMIPNATFGVNIISRSLKLQAGDEVLITDHEYGACYNTWLFKAQRAGAKIIEQKIKLPVPSTTNLAEELWKSISPRTKVIFLSHITSPTALTFPVKEICQKARDEGILTVIDGAHAPGQMDVDLTDINPDFYVGNCHKWMLSAKGSGFLYTKEQHQDQLEPLVVSWGWGENSPYTTESRFLNNLEWWGTKDPAAYLTVKAAVEFLEKHHWGSVQEHSNQLLSSALERVAQITRMPPAYPEYSRNHYHQMAIAPLPFRDRTEEFQADLYKHHHIEVPIIKWKDKVFARISIQAYNNEQDIDSLAQALKELLPKYL